MYHLDHVHVNLCLIRKYLNWSIHWTSGYQSTWIKNKEISSRLNFLFKNIELQAWVNEKHKACLFHPQYISHEWLRTFCSLTLSWLNLHTVWAKTCCSAGSFMCCDVISLVHGCGRTGTMICKIKAELKMELPPKKRCGIMWIILFSKLAVVI